MEPAPIVELRGGSWWERSLPTDSHAAQPCFPLSAAEDLYQRGRILAATELELEKIGQAAWATARYATVLARMSPPGKAKLVEILRQDDRVVMVGDGGNDVGALAAADAGIAIWPTEHPLDTDFFFDDWAMRTRWQRLQREDAQAFQRKISQKIEEQRSWYVQEVERRRRAGQTLDWQQLVKLLRQGQRRLAEETRKAKADQGADQADQASAVAPFTSRTLLAVPEMLRQGQCTSCSMVMQTQQLVLSRPDRTVAATYHSEHRLGSSVLSCLNRNCGRLWHEVQSLPCGGMQRCLLRALGNQKLGESTVWYTFGLYGLGFARCGLSSGLQLALLAERKRWVGCSCARKGNKRQLPRLALLCPMCLDSSCYLSRAISHGR